jgi:type III secretion system low calcium response chaperone LcrH/SycD
METLKVPGQREGETLENAVNRLLVEGNGKDIPLPHLSKDGIDALYAFAYGFYESGNFEKAMHFFRFLTLIDISNRRHWMGLGAAYQMLKQYERALQCYGQAALLDEKDPYAHWYAAECFLALKNNDLAKQAMISAEMTAKPYPKKYKTLLDRLDLLKNGPPKEKKIKVKNKKNNPKTL